MKATVFNRMSANTASIGVTTINGTSLFHQFSGANPLTVSPTAAFS